MVITLGEVEILHLLVQVEGYVIHLPRDGHVWNEQGFAVGHEHTHTTVLVEGSPLYHAGMVP